MLASPRASALMVLRLVIFVLVIVDVAALRPAGPSAARVDEADGPHAAVVSDEGAREDARLRGKDEDARIGEAGDEPAAAECERGDDAGLVRCGCGQAVCAEEAAAV
jgi:hypothetical protein